MYPSENTIRRDLLIAPADELVDINALLDHFERDWTRPGALTLLHNYLSLQTTLPIDDAPMRRICEVMTKNGCITTESCEGHSRELPIIFFSARELENIADLSYILRKASAGKNFIWEVTVEAKYNSAPSAYPIDFTLRPMPRKNEVIDPQRDREKLLFDIHFLGASFLAFFDKK